MLDEHGENSLQETPRGRKTVSRGVAFGAGAAKRAPLFQQEFGDLDGVGRSALADLVAAAPPVSYTHLTLPTKLEV